MAHCSLLWSAIASQATLPLNRALSPGQHTSMGIQVIPCRWTLCKGTEDVIPDSSGKSSPYLPLQPFWTPAWRLFMGSENLKANPKITWLLTWPSLPLLHTAPKDKFLPASHTYPPLPLLSNGLQQDLSLSQVLQVTREYGSRLDGEGSLQHFSLNLLPEILRNKVLLRALRLQHSTLLFKLKVIFED